MCLPNMREANAAVVPRSLGRFRVTGPAAVLTESHYPSRAAHPVSRRVDSGHGRLLNYAVSGRTCCRTRVMRPGPSREDSCQEAIPICSPGALWENPTDYVVILPRNIAREVRTQLTDLVHRAVCFVTAVPELSLL